MYKSKKKVGGKFSRFSYSEEKGSVKKKSQNEG